MNKKKTIGYFLLTVILMTGPTHEISGQISQSAAIQNIDLKPESLYLVTDRSIYISGETIHFSSHYIPPDNINGEHLSKTLYLELFDNKKNSIQKKKFRIDGRRVNGSISIPKDLQTGYYYLRAFTSYARNFLPEYSPVKVLEIVNPDIPPETNEGIKGATVEIIPANKKIYSDCKNPVAIRMEHSFSVKCDSIQLISSIKKERPEKVYFNGKYGFFNFSPNDSSDYLLRFYLNNGDSLTKQLDVMEKPGFLISRSSLSEEAEFYIQTESSKKIIVRVYSAAGILIHENEIEGSQTNFKQNPEFLSEGINYLLFTDQNDSLLHLSVVYKPISPRYKLNIKTDKNIYSPREKVSLSINKPFQNIEVEDLNISVIKKGTACPAHQLPDFLKENIFLLPSGYERLNTKENALNTQVNIGLILYMNKLLDKEVNFPTPEFSGKITDRISHDEAIWLPETRELMLSGIAKNKETGEAITGVPLIASVLFDRPQFHINTTDQDGNFFFSFYGLQDTKELVIRPMFPGSQPEILVNSDFGARHAPLTTPYPVYDSLKILLIRDLFINSQLNEIFYKPLQKAGHQSPNILGDLIEWIKLDNFIALPSMHEVFKEIIPSGRFLVSEEKAEFGVLDGVKNVWYDNPLVLLDNIPINDPMQVAEINPSAIDEIGIINSTYILGDHFLPGIIFIKSKAGKFAGIDLSENATFLEYQMYSPETVHKYPEYNTTEKKKSRRADFRNTLYWNPGIQLTADTNLHFYTSDHLSEYEIIVEGFTSTGKYISGRHRFEVR